MDKHDILEKSRKENQYQDERDEQIELQAYRVGLKMVVITTGILYLLLLVKSRLDGSSFRDWYLVALPIFANAAGAGWVKWRNYKRKGDLINAACGLIFVLLVFWMRLFGPIGG